MTADEYWDALRAIGITKTRRLTPESWACTDRDGGIVSVEDPTSFSPEQRAAMFTLYRRRFCPLDC